MFLSAETCATNKKVATTKSSSVQEEVSNSTGIVLNSPNWMSFDKITSRTAGVFLYCLLGWLAFSRAGSIFRGWLENAGFQEYLAQLVASATSGGMPVAFIVVMSSSSEIKPAELAKSKIWTV